MKLKLDPHNPAFCSALAICHTQTESECDR